MSEPLDRSPEYFRRMAALSYAKKKVVRTHCPLCDCYIISIRFAKHEATKKHLRMIELRRIANVNLDKMFADLAVK